MSSNDSDYYHITYEGGYDKDSLWYFYMEDDKNDSSHWFFGESEQASIEIIEKGKIKPPKEVFLSVAANVNTNYSEFGYDDFCFFIVSYDGDLASNEIVNSGKISVKYKFDHEKNFTSDKLPIKKNNLIIIPYYLFKKMLDTALNNLTTKTKKTYFKIILYSTSTYGAVKYTFHITTLYDVLRTIAKNMENNP